MSAILRWLFTQATRGVLGQIIRSVLEGLGIWKFVVAVPIAISVAVMAMAEGLQSVAVVLMFGMAAFVLVLLHYLSLLYERIREKYFGDAFAAERRQIAKSEIATLTADEQAALRQMLVVGRPKDLSDQIWRSLENKTSFVERDFTGPKGIKNEFRSVLEDILNKKNGTTIISSLRMTIGESGPYFGTEGSVYSIRRTFNLKLENTDRSKSLSDCSIHIREVVPPTDYQGPWLLQDGIVLAAGAHTFIPLVTYGEAREPDKYPSGDTFMTMGTANGHPCLDVGEEYTVALRVTAQNTAFCDFECRIWVDENGRLRIANATPTTADKPGAIPTDVIDRSDSLLPDWPMKELCQHVLDNIDDSEEVIREIEAKARLGELACWGRRYSALRAFDNPNPPRPVPQDHWDGYCLDYLRCVFHEDPTECRTEPRDVRGDHTESYQDLQVNRRQSMSIWPVRSE